MSDAAKTPAQIILLPQGRLINESLFEKDAYVDPQTQKEGTPSYKVELAFDPAQVKGENTVEDALLAAAKEKWGASIDDEFFGAKEDGSALDAGVVAIQLPYLNGDALAKRRADKGKEGDAYKGKLVIRANTIYNLNGQDAPGGIQVFDEAAQAVTIANRQVIYPGCFGIAAVTIWGYLDNRGNKAMKFYLSAFQKTADGDKLITGRDHSSLFKPLRPAAATGVAGVAAAGGARRARKG